MKKCPICGSLATDSARFCPRCGSEVNGGATVYGSVYNGDSYAIEEKKLNEDYAKRAKSAFNLSIVSIILCCCTITSIVSLILSISLMKDLNKMSDEIKMSDEYRKVKNKNMAALIISVILVLMGIFNMIDSVVNGAQYEDMYNSMLNSILEELEAAQ